MIPVKEKSTVQTNLTDAKAFTIAATAKAFKTLIDGLYSDKIAAPVRELMSNAWDSHREAGKGDVPFQVLIPTDVDPVFGVRDYGVGMDHETVMDLYTTLFSSSKEETNEQVGMLGLGSKSPFAYVDSFNVTCFDADGTKRVYLAYLETDGTPKLSFVGKSDSGGEEQGVFVSFPVRIHDRSLFIKAIEKYILGFSPTPTLDGGTCSTPELVLSGDGWAVYTNQDRYFTRGEAITVKMGCIMYPYSFNQYGRLDANFRDHGYSVVVDVPIGTADVATSREAIVVNDKLRDLVDKKLEEAWDAVIEKLKAEVDAHRTSEYDFAVFLGTGEVPRSLWKRLGIDPSEASLKLGESSKTTVVQSVGGGGSTIANVPLTVQRLTVSGRPASSGRVYALTPAKVNNSTFYYRKGDKRVVRQAQRIAAVGRGGFWISDDEALAAVKKVWRATNIKEVSTLPDPGPPANSNPATRKKVSELQKELDDPKALWAVRKHKQVTVGSMTVEADLFERVFNEYAKTAGYHVVYVTPHKAETLKLDAAKGAMAYLTGALKKCPKLKKAANLQLHQELRWSLAEQIESSQTLLLLNALVQLGVLPAVPAPNSPDARVPFETRRMADLLDVTVPADEKEKEVIDKAKEIYPKLFDKFDAKAYIEGRTAEELDKPTTT